jgi:hypothetical protein
MEFFVTTVSKVHDDQWDLPGLGEWAVRDLVGHIARAVPAAAQFAAPSADSSAGTEQSPPDIPTRATYYQRAFLAEGSTGASWVQDGKPARR